MIPRIVVLCVGFGAFWGFWLFFGDFLWLFGALGVLGGRVIDRAQATFVLIDRATLYREASQITALHLSWL